MYKWIFAAFLLLNTAPSLSLEYLSDDELSSLDGYTSAAMLKEYDSEGNVIFRRGDSEPCRYDQSDASDDARAGCENAFEDDYDALLASSFQRYLDQALVLMQAEKQLDIPGDGLQQLDLSIRLDNFDYNHFMCDGMPSKGVIRFEGISLTGRGGGDLRLRSTTTLGHVLNTTTGKTKTSILIKSEPMDGALSIRAIKIGDSVESAAASPSLGGLTVAIGAAELSISRTEK